MAQAPEQGLIFWHLNDFDRYGNTWQNVISTGVNYYDWLHSNSFYFDEGNNHIYISYSTKIEDCNKLNISFTKLNTELLDFQNL